MLLTFLAISLGILQKEASTSQIQGVIGAPRDFCFDISWSKRRVGNRRGLSHHGLKGHQESPRRAADLSSTNTLPLFDRHCSLCATSCSFGTLFSFYYTVLLRALRKPASTTLSVYCKQTQKILRPSFFTVVYSYALVESITLRRVCTHKLSQSPSSTTAFAILYEEMQLQA